MDIISLPLPPTLRSKLLSAGYRSSVDFRDIDAFDLARNAFISEEDAEHVLKMIPGTNLSELSEWSEIISGAKSAWELLIQEKIKNKLSTQCKEVDKILEGGIALKEVTELCGVPGVGKTQLGMQLSINVQLPTCFGGLEGQAIYIDTEGSFLIERITQMADAWLHDLKQNPSTSSSSAPSAPSTSSTDKISHLPPNRTAEIDRNLILSNIFYFRIFDYTEQIALLNALPSFLHMHSNVKAIIIDSITFHFRVHFDDMGLRTRLLSSMAKELQSMAEKFNLSVILLNQVTTKISGDECRLVPALGESWSHACTNRFIVYWGEDEERHFHIFKSPYLKVNDARFAVTSEGVRDLQKISGALKRTFSDVS